MTVRSFRIVWLTEFFKVIFKLFNEVTTILTRNQPKWSQLSRLSTFSRQQNLFCGTLKMYCFIMCIIKLMEGKALRTPGLLKKASVSI